MDSKEFKELRRLLDAVRSRAVIARG
jgi:hypothetical protein